MPPTPRALAWPCRTRLRNRWGRTASQRLLGPVRRRRSWRMFRREIGATSAANTSQPHRPPPKPERLLPRPRRGAFANLAEQSGRGQVPESPQSTCVTSDTSCVPANPAPKRSFWRQPAGASRPPTSRGLRHAGKPSYARRKFRSVQLQPPASHRRLPCKWPARLSMPLLREIGNLRMALRPSRSLATRAHTCKQRLPSSVGVRIHTAGCEWPRAVRCSDTGGTSPARRTQTAPGCHSVVNSECVGIHGLLVSRRAHSILP
mmetsp:Transcript_121791/g.303920  ORF Transcript_121791/g.303920 Transcript_121791/m.303920 type:complete len:261 (-) Transcript_121791:288-1070(-)